jgi:adenosylhomocysteinase
MPTIAQDRNAMKKTKTTPMKNSGKSPLKTKSFQDYRVCREAMESEAVFKKLAVWGREEITMAEQEMPGLMALRKEFGKQQPSHGSSQGVWFNSR